MVDRGLLSVGLAIALAAAAANPADAAGQIFTVTGTNEIDNSADADAAARAAALAKQQQIANGGGGGTGLGGLATNAWKNYERSLGLSLDLPPLPSNAPSPSPFLARGESLNILWGVFQRVGPDEVNPNLVDAVQGTMRVEQDMKTIGRTVDANIASGNLPLVNAYAAAIDPRFGQAVDRAHTLPAYYSTTVVQNLVICDLNERRNTGKKGKPTYKCPQTPERRP